MEEEKRIPPPWLQNILVKDKQITEYLLECMEKSLPRGLSSYKNHMQFLGVWYMLSIIFGLFRVLVFNRKKHLTEKNPEKTWFHKFWI